MTKKSKLTASTIPPAVLDAFVDPPSSEAGISEPAKSKRGVRKPKRGKIKLPRGTTRRVRRSGRTPSLFHRPGSGPALLVDAVNTSNSAPTANNNALPADGADHLTDDPAANENMRGTDEDAHSIGKAISVVVGPDSLAVTMPVDDKAPWEALTAEFLALNEKGVESVVGKGIVILRGKAKDKPEGHRHGEYGPWLVNQLRLGKNVKAALWQAAMFMRIAEHSIISDRRYWRSLPGSYRTLWELSHIPEEILIEHINGGRVHHDLSRSEAENLRKEVLCCEESDGDTSDHESSDNAPNTNLPLPPIPKEGAVLLKVVRYFIADKIIRAHMRANEDVSGFPSNSALDAAVRWAKEEYSRMRGGR